MIDILLISAAGAGVSLLGICLTALRVRKRAIRGLQEQLAVRDEDRHRLQIDVAAKATEVGICHNKIAELELTVSNREQRIEEFRNQFLQTSNELERAKSQLIESQRSGEREKTFFDEINLRNQERFETIAQKLFEQNSDKLEANSFKQISTVLQPLKEKLSEFEKRVETTYQAESRERFSLKKEVERLLEANQKISDDANNLTRALRGDVKMQGHWGEVKLDLILEQSGLSEGSEYVKQARGQKLTDEDGKRQMPDVIVHLPENKHIVIDSKVTLSSYERWVNLNSDHGDNKLNQSDLTKLRQSVLKEFATSITNHVNGLSKKFYDGNSKLNSPDFVIMFCPVEGAFSLAMEADRQVFSNAWEKRIIIVSPSTLLATLRTVASIWRSERQNKNAAEIARKAGSLYDKFVGFVKDLEKVGKSIQQAEKNYESALSKLTIGRGNLVASTEKLKELGAKTQKKISDEALADRISEDSKDSEN